MILNTERSYITRLNCSACQSLPITNSNATISLVGKCNQLAFGVARFRLESFSKLKLDSKKYKK